MAICLATAADNSYSRGLAGEDPVNDSSRVLRVVCRINPNDGLYEAIVNPDTARIERHAHVMEIIQAKGRAERTKQEPPEPRTPIESTKPSCATCFSDIEAGTFVVSKNGKLFFCNKCSATGCVDRSEQAAEFLVWLFVLTLMAVIVGLGVGALWGVS